MSEVAFLDYETRSACNLRKSGAWRYSEHASTEILCAAIRLPYWRRGRVELWHPEFKHLGMLEEGTDALVEFFNWIISGGLVEAHNAQFERCITKNIAVPKHGWPDIAGHQWRCSAAAAAAHALPRGLDDAAAALGLKQRKDAAGGKTMLKLSKPRKARKKEVEDWKAAHGKKPIPILWHESKELFDILFEYCKQDIQTEQAVSEAVPPLSEDEQRLYTLDQTINERGFLLDMEAVGVALDLIADETSRLNAELKALTGGSPDKATQRKKIHDWFLDQWVIIEDTKAGTVDEALKRDDLTPEARRGLELLQAGSRSSTAKYEAMRNWACRDGRVRGGLLYHGASTGRWPITGDHELLTPTGWVRLDEWNGGKIACWSADGSMSWGAATRLVFDVQPGERLVHWQNAKVDQISTSDHDMPVFTRTRRSPVTTKVWGGEFERRPMSDIGSGNRIPLCGLLGSREWRYSDVQTRVLLMTQADGHYVTENGAAIRYRFKKQRKIDRCQALLIEACVPHRMRVDACDGATVITVAEGLCPAWLWDFNKVLTWDWLNADSDVVFSELSLWDGCKSSPEGIDFSTGVQQNADVIQALAHLSGRTCKVNARERTDEGWNTSWRCFIDNDPAPVTFRKAQCRATETTERQVFCTQTPTGYFLVRRNGHAWITGNSGAGVQPHNFPRGTVKDIEGAWAALKTRDRAVIEAFDPKGVAA